MLGPGKARRLEKSNIYTLGDAALLSQYNEEWFYKTFGIDGEIFLAHVWGQDPVTLKDIKNYHPDGHSLSSGQVLPRPYRYKEARLVFSEMIDMLCQDMFAKSCTAPSFSWFVSYDYKSLEEVTYYDGEVVVDYYGRLHPKHSNGTVRMPMDTNSQATILPRMLHSFDTKCDHRLLFRRLNICAQGVHEDSGCYQLNFFIDYDSLEKERKLQEALLDLRTRYGANAVFKGKNMLKGATQLERNMQIGGHRA